MAKEKFEIYGDKQYNGKGGNPITQKQRTIIQNYQEVLGIIYNGPNSSKHAYKFIQDHKAEYERLINS